MAGINSSILPASALLNAAAVANFSLPLAATEYTINVPTGSKQFILQARGQTTLQIATTSGQSGTVYFTVHPYSFYAIDSVVGTIPTVLYVQSTKPSQIVEILYWV